MRLVTADAPRDELVPDFFRRVVEKSVSGPMPQNRRLVTILPVEKFDTEKNIHYTGSWGDIGYVC